MLAIVLVAIIINSLINTKEICYFLHFRFRVRLLQFVFCSVICVSAQEVGCQSRITVLICMLLRNLRDFLGGPVVKNLPSNAGDLGSIPGLGTKIPHAAGQLSPSALEPACHN